jgi:hypothetical protein
VDLVFLERLFLVYLADLEKYQMDLADLEDPEMFLTVPEDLEVLEYLVNLEDLGR